MYVNGSLEARRRGTGEGNRCGEEEKKGAWTGSQALQKALRRDVGQLALSAGLLHRGSVGARREHEHRHPGRLSTDVLELDAR